MKKVFILIFMLAGLICTEVRANSDSLYQKANALYQDGEYEMALTTYHDIILGGFESSGLYYNMGNAAFRSNSIGYSVLYYEKALKLDPSNEDARHNLDFVSQYRVDTFEPVPELFLHSWYRDLVKLFPEKSWSLLAIILFILLLAGILIYLFSHRLSVKKTGFFLALLGLLLFVVAISAASSSNQDIVSPGAGIIISPSVIVRSSPSDTGTELFVLHEGTRVKLNEEISGWQNIRVIDGREGWILSGEFENI